MQSVDGIKTDWADDVSRPCDEYTDMAKRWAVIDLVLGDTLTIRACKEQVLPKLPYEKKGYENRVKQLVLTPWFRRLVNGLVGVVLRKQPDVTNVNEQIKAHLDDVTLAGDDLLDFLRSLFLNFAEYGTVGILVDAPNYAARLKSEEVAYNLRPYWSCYCHLQILGFRTGRVNNVRKLTQIRLLEEVDEPVGLYGGEKIRQIRELNLRTFPKEDGTSETVVYWAVHRQSESEWFIHGEGFIETSEIPFYMAPDFGFGLPPFLQIAFLNIAETRKNAELDHLLSLCANQKAVFAGFDFEDGDDDGEAVTLAPEDGYVSENPSANVTYVGANVAPAQVLMTRIEKIQSDMMNLAIAAIHTQKNMAETADSKRLDRVQSDSMMALMADDMEKLVNAALVGHGRMMGVDDVGAIALNKEFSNEILPVETAKFYADLVVQDKLTLETFFELLIKGELLPDEMDAKAELLKIKKNSGKLTT
jgi:Domain of unknown function (DUF4055)